MTDQELPTAARNSGARAQPARCAVRRAYAVRDARLVSIGSLTWTLAAGFAACATGVTTHSLALVAFGAINLLDAAGSAALVIHFGHSLRHGAASPRLERVALRFVTTGMLVVGLATIAESVHRLATHASADINAIGIALAGCSVVVLATLGFAKRRLARSVGSHALLADGWVSAMGSFLAVVTLSGTGLRAAFGWTWVDSSAAILVASGAIALSVALGRDAYIRPYGDGVLRRSRLSDAAAVPGSEQGVNSSGPRDPC